MAIIHKNTSTDKSLHAVIRLVVPSRRDTVITRGAAVLELRRCRDLDATRPRPQCLDDSAIRRYLRSPIVLSGRGGGGN